MLILFQSWGSVKTRSLFIRKQRLSPWKIVRVYKVWSSGKKKKNYLCCWSFAIIPFQFYSLSLLMCEWLWLHFQYSNLVHHWNSLWMYTFYTHCFASVDISIWFLCILSPVPSWNPPTVYTWSWVLISVGALLSAFSNVEVNRSTSRCRLLFEKLNYKSFFILTFGWPRSGESTDLQEFNKMVSMQKKGYLLMRFTRLNMQNQIWGN